MPDDLKDALLDEIEEKADEFLEEYRTATLVSQTVMLDSSFAAITKRAIRELRRYRRREDLHGALLANLRRAEERLEEPPHVSGPLVLLASHGPAMFERFEYRAGDQTKRFGLFDASRFESGRPIDDPFMVSKQILARL